jgi:serine/threonine-protein kinase HipA
MLYLIGENLDKRRGHYRAEIGRLVQLMRGIYVDPAGDADAIVLKHAIRIAKYLYPKAYLSGASAGLLGPTNDGRLFLSARRKQRTRIRSLEIIQNEAPEHPSVNEAIIDDGMGEFRVAISSIRQRFLEAFRLRSEHAAAMDDKMRSTIAARLVEEYGSGQAAADAVWMLARENEWYREGEAAERYLLRRKTAVAVKNEAAINLAVAWHGVLIGRLSHDGFEWRWMPIDYDGPPLVRQTTPGKLPAFISSLLPEGWLAQVLNEKDERSLLRSGKRYMSNITIAESEAALAQLPQDILTARLAQCMDDGAFIGTYGGPGRTEIEGNFERNLANIYARADTPRLSGIQIKAPMYLDGGGAISPAEGTPFTHILKPAGTSGYDALPVIEWTAMFLGRAVGLEAPTVALVAMPDELPPALLVERFDIREGQDDTRMLALEDFCSVLDLPAEAKYGGTIERVARGARPLSSSATDDLIVILKRALFAWLIADGDMHLKNLAMLKIADPGKKTFRSVRMAPLYDAVTTRIFPRLKHDRMALKISGKDDNLRRADFRTFAATAGLKTVDADAAIDEMLSGTVRAIDGFKFPGALRIADESKNMIHQMLDICRTRTKSFA